METELGKILCRIVNAFLFNVDEEKFDPEMDEAVVQFVRERSERSDTPKNPEGMDLLSWAIEFYNHRFEEETASHKKEMASVNAELDRIAETLMAGVPSERVREALNRRMAVLDEQAKVLQPKLIPLTDTVNALTDQLRAIRKSIEVSDGNAKAKLLDSFIDHVMPHFVGEPIPGHGRAIDFEFFPKNAANNVMPQPMKIDGSRTGRGSSRRPG